MGTRDRELIRLIVSRCEKDLGTIKADFEFLYKKPLASVVSVSNCHLAYFVTLFTLMNLLKNILFYREKLLVYGTPITRNHFWLLSVEVCIEMCGYSYPDIKDIRLSLPLDHDVMASNHVDVHLF